MEGQKAPKEDGGLIWAHISSEARRLQMRMYIPALMCVAADPERRVHLSSPQESEGQGGNGGDGVSGSGHGS